jgi:hypothetical protein
MAEGGDPTAGREVVDGPKRRLERLYLGLRTADGVPSEEVALAGFWVEAARERGWIEVADGAARLTPEGWLRLDELAAGLTTSAEGG